MSVQQPPQNRREGSSTNRGVSDAIGFTVMFSIIIIGAGLISLGGGAQIVTLSEVEEIRSAERGMESTAATLQPMASDGDQQRSFSVAFSNSNIWMNESTLNITTADGWDEYEELQVNSLEQRFSRSNEDVTVRYEGGGVFRSNAVPAYDPVFTCSANDNMDDTAIITVVNLTLEDRDGLYLSQGYDPDTRFNEFADSEDPPITSTDEAINFRAHLVNTTQNVSDPGSPIIVNTSQTSGPEQWDHYFDNQEEWEPQSPDHVYECDADRTLIRVVTIELEIIEPRFSD